MNRVPVKSSNILSVGYDTTNSTLEVEFKEGGVYQYFDVPSRVHSGLMTASSHGGYFAANIKKGGYRYNRVG